MPKTDRKPEPMTMANLPPDMMVVNAYTIDGDLVFAAVPKPGKRLAKQKESET